MDNRTCEPSAEAAPGEGKKRPNRVNPTPSFTFARGCCILKESSKAERIMRGLALEVIQNQMIAQRIIVR
jgi:hypothetical protein